LLVTAIAFSVPSLPDDANVGMAIGRDGDAAAREVADVFFAMQGGPSWWSPRPTIIRTMESPAQNAITG
jgi:hypothetical protein